MSRWIYVVLHLLFEGLAARRDARVRFLLAQVEILRSKIDGNRIVPSPGDRARLMAIGRELGHDVKDIIAVVKPETYRRWLRESRIGKEPRSAGRPKISAVRRRLIVRFAKENLGWGYRRIVGELHKLHLPVGRSTIRRILQEEGLTPPPKRRRPLPTETPWRKFLRLHMNTLVACDFFTKNVITPLGAHTAYCLFFIHLGTRKVFMCPTTYHPGLAAHWPDRVHSAAQTNAFAESWIGSLKRECLDHFLCFSRKHLDFILNEYVRFHNRYHPHQGLGNHLPCAAAGCDPPPPEAVESAPIRCQRFLGGLLRHYYRAAA